MKKNSINAIALILLAAVLSAALMTSCSDTVKLDFDKTAAEESVAKPEYRLTITFKDERGDNLTENDKIVLSDGCLKTRVLLKYTSSLSRTMGLMYFIDGVPQSFSVNGKDADYYYDFDISSAADLQVDCKPKGVKKQKDAKISLIILGNNDTTIYYGGDKADPEPIVFTFNTDLGSLNDSNEDVYKITDYPLISETLELTGIPDPKELKEAGIKPEEHLEYLNGLTDKLSAAEIPCAVINTAGTVGFLGQSSVVSINRNRESDEQVYFEAVGRPGERYRTSVFVDDKPQAAFDGHITTEWKLEKGRYFNHFLSLEHEDNYNEHRIFAVTLSDDGKACHFTPKLLMVNTDGLIMNNSTSLRATSYATDQEGKELMDLEQYSGGDLSLTVNLDCSNTPIRMPYSALITIDGEPVYFTVGSDRVLLYDFDIETGESVSFELKIAEADIIKTDFELAVQFVERFDGRWYNTFLWFPTENIAPIRIRFAEDIDDDQTDSDHLEEEEDFNSLPITTDWNVPGYVDRQTKLINIPLADADLTYNGNCYGNDYINRAYVIFNGEILPFADGRDYFEWSGEKGAVKPVIVHVPKEKMNKLNTAYVLTLAYKDNALAASGMAFCSIRVHGEADGDKISVFVGKEQTLVSIGSPDTFSPTVYCTDDSYSHIAVSGVLRLPMTSFLKGENDEYLFDGTFQQGTFIISKNDNGSYTVNVYKEYNPNNIK